MEDGSRDMFTFGRYLDIMQREPDGRWRFLERVAEVEAWESGKSKPALEQLTSLEQIRQRSVRAGVLLPEHAFAS